MADRVTNDMVACLGLVIAIEMKKDINGNSIKREIFPNCKASSDVISMERFGDKESS